MVMDRLEPLITEWRSYVGDAQAVSAHDVEELEAHLRDQIADLEKAGLTDEEAFLVAVRRLGEVDELSREFATEHSGRLWRQLVTSGEPESTSQASGLPLALMLAVLAAVAIQIPRLVGMDEQQLVSFYLRNAGFLVLPLVAWLFGARNGLSVRQMILTAAPFVIGAVLVNLYPLEPGSSSEALVGIHLPVALWFVVAYPYMGGTLHDHRRRMDFVRFTGEGFIYYVLIALGGMVLVALTAFILEPLGPEVVETVIEWVVPSGAAGALLVAAWLVEEKKSVVENMAPVLTLIFTPLFAVMLAVSAVIYAVGGLGSEFDREAVFVLDILLIVVLGLLLYRISARDGTQPPGIMDRIELVAVVGALALDVLVLSTMITRIGELGFTPNRAAALGLNLVLAVNLVWASWLSFRFIRSDVAFQRLERWQTSYLPVYAIWAAFVALVIPPLFSWV
jgi:hypothetical protein